MDLDLVVFVVIVLLASKSFICSFALPSAIALRLGRDSKARRVPTSSRIAAFQGFSKRLSGAQDSIRERQGHSVKKIDENIAPHTT